MCVYRKCVLVVVKWASIADELEKSLTVSLLPTNIFILVNFIFIEVAELMIADSTERSHVSFPVTSCPVYLSPDL